MTNQTKLINDNDQHNSNYKGDLQKQLDKIYEDPVGEIFGRINRIQTKLDELHDYVRHGRTQIVDTAFLNNKLQPIINDVDDLKNQNNIIHSIADKFDTTPQEITSIKQQVYNNIKRFNEIHHTQAHLQKQIDAIVDILKHNKLDLEPKNDA